MCDNPFPIRHLSPTLEALDFRQLKWPGHGCDAMSENVRAMIDFTKEYGVYG